MGTRNPRRVALELLRNIKRNTATMIAVWGGHQQTWDAVARDWRKLTDAEKHENNPEQWDRLAAFMDQVVADAKLVREYAQGQGREARERQDED